VGNDGKPGHVRAAYEDLLRRYLPALRRLAWSYTRDPSEIEDLLQEIALGLWTALAHFRGDATERTWLYRVAHNTAISFISSNRRRAQREQSGDILEHFPDGALSPESTAIDEQRRDRLREAIEDLGLTDKQIVVLHLEGLSAAEIEAVTGLSAGNVATRLTRARQRLSVLIREEAHER
jgi:RNA polymerase sigma-70 factor (ECF subfamily)